MGEYDVFISMDEVDFNEYDPAYEFELDLANYVYGYIYNERGSYVKLALKNNLKNIASFISKCPPNCSLVVTDLLDRLVLSTIGNFLDKIADMSYREKLLPVLIPMQMYEEVPGKIEFTYGNEDGYLYGTTSKEDFVAFVLRETGYSL